MSSVRVGEAYAAGMANNGNMSKKLNYRRLTRQQEVFCALVA